MKESVGKRGLGNEFLSTKALRCVEGSPSPCSSSFSPLFHLLCPWRLRCLSCFLLRVRHPSLSTSELSPLIFQWNVAGAPLFFSLGCGHAVLAASWRSSTWPLASQPLRLFFPFVPHSSLPSLLPLGDGKAVQIFQVY